MPETKIKQQPENSYKGNLLMLVHRVPFPPDKGDKIRSFNQIKFLSSRGWKIYLVALADKDEDIQHRETLLNYCEDVHIFPMNSSIQKLTSLFRPFLGLPLSSGYFYKKSFQKTVDSLLDSIKIKAVLCFCSPMAEYLYKLNCTGNIPFLFRDIVTVMDFVDVDSDKWKQYAIKHRFPMSWVYRMESVLLRKYENKIVKDFDQTILVSAEEVEMLGKSVGNPEKVDSVANGVDLEYFSPTVENHEKSNASIVFCGAMDYFPNVDAVQWFVNKVFVQIQNIFPDVEFYIVGGGAGEEVKSLGQILGVVVTGRVEDVRPYVREATLSVAPIRVARGIQNKVLEAMAMSKAVLTTPEAFEGIEAVPGRDVVVVPAEPEAFIRTTLQLLQDKALRLELGGNARKLVEQKYSWSARLSCLDEHLSQQKNNQ